MTGIFQAYPGEVADVYGMYIVYIQCIYVYMYIGK